MCAGLLAGVALSNNAFAKEDCILSGNETEDEQWNLKAIEVDEVSKEDTTSLKKVKIAVLDSGVDYSEDVNVVERKDFLGEDISPLYEDGTGHGTAVAAVIASSGENDTIKGINPNVEIYSAKILDGNNKASIDKVVKAIDWAIEKKVNIINMSFGKTYDSITLHNAIKRAERAGILMIASAGNGGNSEEGNVEYPAAYDEVVAVGAVTPEGELSKMTSTGEELELLAPGEYIKTTGWLDLECVSSGTSFAVPHAVGIASLLWQKDFSKSADYIRKLLKASAKTLTDENGKEYSLIDYEYACKIYDEYNEVYNEDDDVEEIINEFENEAEADDYSDEVEGRWSQQNHIDTVNNCYNEFNCYYGDAEIVKLGAVAPDVYCPFGIYPSHEMFHAKSKYGEHNYVRVCEYIMNLATHCKNYGHRSSLSADCRPDNVSDNDYNTVKGWLGESEITVMLNNQYVYNDYNASLIMLGVAMHVMGDTYAHQTREYRNGILVKPATNDIDSNSRLHYAKESIMNLWTNYYNNIKTNGTDYEGNAKKFKISNLYQYSIASTNGKSKNWSAFTDLKKISY